MAVAAYASLVSLTNVLKNLHYRARFHLPRVDVKLVEKLQENVHVLLEFVELHSERKSPNIEGLWRKMAEVAFEAEDMINFHVVHRLIRMESEGERSDAGLSTFCEYMERVIQKFHSIKEELSNIQEEGEDAFVLASSLKAASASGGNNVVAVGIDEHVLRIMDQLTADESNLQILPITGMGGIGKTTLARSIFNHPYIVEKFDIHMWLTISQEYSVEQILKGLLSGEGNKGACESLDELGEQLYKKLFGRKFFIVMDDVWDIKVWDELKKFFPKNGIGSRIVLTTRISEVADCLGSYNPYPLTFLDNDKSWDLFCQSTFTQIGCPYVELEAIGKKIVESCRGLPLEITVIGRLLANSNMTREYWEFVLENIHSLNNLSDDTAHCLEILSLSYKALPIHLKICFLYMRVFAEDESIDIYKLIKFWVAEGFIKSRNDKSLEKIAHEYVEALIARNLIFKKKYGGFYEADFSGIVYQIGHLGEEEFYCGIHDLLRELCFRESHNVRFIQSLKVRRVGLYHHFERDSCFLCSKRITNKEGMSFLEHIQIFPLSSQFLPFVCDACKMRYSHITRPTLTMTKVMSLVDDEEFTVIQPTELRHVVIESCCGVDCISLSRLHILWNIQYLIFSVFDPIVLPVEIWSMPQLRFIGCRNTVILPHPEDTHIDGEDSLVLTNLEHLLRLINFECTNEVLKRIPNIKFLWIDYEEEEEEDAEGKMKRSNYSLCNLAKLHKLEILVICQSFETISFPNSLKVVYLKDCQMEWKEMSILGLLPNLESIILINSTEGSDWNLIEGEFLRLKRLSIDSTHLEHWIADQNHFPILKKLERCDLKFLKEIPSGIGDIPTLQLVKLEKCPDSVLNSAHKIWEEQQSLGNESLRILVDDKPIDELLGSAFKSLQIGDDASGTSSS